MQSFFYLNVYFRLFPGGWIILFENFADFLFFRKYGRFHANASTPFDSQNALPLSTYKWFPFVVVPREFSVMKSHVSVPKFFLSQTTP